ncbi:MAG: hypothetical protein HY332_15295 [Chloroflexi bacterium]|nr:hypothetical protein [Chloroflexota bacterium]
MTNQWDEEFETPTEQAARLVSGLVRLERDEEACRLLGVDGTLEDEVDVTFLNDPLAWIANEIATGMRLEVDEAEGVSLSSLVALLKLYRILRSGTLDEEELRDAIVDALQQLEDEEA